MKFKHTFILLVLAVGLGAYVWFVDRKMPTTKEREEKKGRLFEFDRDQISAIMIKTPEEKIELKKDGTSWLVESPVKDRADSGAMNTLLTSIELLRSDATVDNEGKGTTKEQLKEFGLTEPQTKLTLTVDGKPISLLFGKDTAIENRVYVMLEGAKNAEVVSNNLRNDISKKVDEFRDKKLSDLSLAQIKKAVIKSQSGEIEVEKKDDHWFLVRPLKARGDDSKVGDTISQALTARVEAFVADTSKAGEYGLEQPRGTVTLTVEGEEKPHVLSIGGNPKDEKDKDKVYARLTSRDAIVLLPQSIEELLKLNPNDLRDKKLIQFNEDIVDRITIEPAGKEKLVLARDTNKGWVRKDGDKDVDVNTTQVTRILDDLQAATVTTFVADVATELPKYGLEQPAIKVTLSSYSSENTAETKAGEQPIVTVLFGKVEGNDAYAKVEEEPFVVSTPRIILESLVTDPLQLQPLEIYKHQPEEIASFEIVRDAQPTLHIERDKDKNWKLAKGDDKLNTINVQSLVNTLASLRAVRWLGATVPDHGFDTPSAIVSFKTSGGASGKLTIGAADEQEMRYATAEGFSGTFLVAKPDFEAFTSSLLDKPATAAPSTTPAPAAPGAEPAAPDATPVPATPAPPPAPAPAPAEAETPKSSEAPAPAPASPQNP